ncbi:unnamed protein product [Closterium sp. NIES-53]
MDAATISVIENVLASSHSLSAVVAAALRAATPGCLFRLFPKPSRAPPPPTLPPIPRATTPCSPNPPAPPPPPSPPAPFPADPRIPALPARRGGVRAAGSAGGGGAQGRRRAAMARRARGTATSFHEIAARTRTRGRACGECWAAAGTRSPPSPRPMRPNVAIALPRHRRPAPAFTLGQFGSRLGDVSRHGAVAQAAINAPVRTPAFSRSLWLSVSARTARHGQRHLPAGALVIVVAMDDRIPRLGSRSRTLHTQRRRNAVANAMAHS